MKEETKDDQRLAASYATNGGYKDRYSTTQTSIKDLKPNNKHQKEEKQGQTTFKRSTRYVCSTFSNTKSRKMGEVLEGCKENNFTWIISHQVFKDSYYNFTSYNKNCMHGKEISKSNTIRLPSSQITVYSYSFQKKPYLNTPRIGSPFFIAKLLFMSRTAPAPSLTWLELPKKWKKYIKV